MASNVQVPDIFRKQRMAQAFAGLNPAEDKLSDGIGGGYPIIHFKGKIWSIRYRGERKTVTRPDDGTPSGHLDVVILGQAKSLSKTYYPGTFVDGSEDRPTCASIDGITPDADVPIKQNDHCSTCPRNEWKTFENGRRGKECQDSKRLAVLVMPVQTKPLFGEPVMEPMFLKVPPASLQSLSSMGDTMSAQGYHYSSYLTRLSFDPDKAHPSIVFRPLQPLGEAEATVVMELRNDPVIDRITGNNADPVTVAVTHQGTITGLNPTVTAPATPRRPQPKPAVVKAVDEAFGSVPDEAKPAPAKKKIGGIKQTAAPAGNGAPPLQQAAPVDPDAGVSESSDDELDEEIARLIQK